MKKLVSISVTMVLILTLVQVIVSNTLSTTGVKLGDMQDQISALHRENMILEEKVLKASSLSHISSQAKDMGFLFDKSTVVISDHIPLAKR